MFVSKNVVTIATLMSVSNGSSVLRQSGMRMAEYRLASAWSAGGLRVVGLDIVADAGQSQRPAAKQFCMMTFRAGAALICPATAAHEMRACYTFTFHVNMMIFLATTTTNCGSVFDVNPFGHFGVSIRFLLFRRLLRGHFPFECFLFKDRH